MSAVYSMEPRTNCKVNINTTYGTICVELWGKECPLASRNFIQLCLEGYYDKSPFDRLVPGFCLQSGRPAKMFEDEPDRNGMAAVLNGRFPIETHSRLKFNRRGLLGMVALSEDDANRANGSQFFFTLSDASELNGRATLFGRVVGDTIFNLLRMGELETDPKTESPLYPPQIIDTDVVINPFSDIIPRERVFLSPDTKICAESAVDTLKKKNFSLLSFTESEHDIDRFDHVKAYSHNKNNISVKNQEGLLKECPSIQPTQPTSSLQFLQQMKAVQMKETEKKIRSMEIELGLSSGGKSSSATNISPSHDTKNISALEKYKQKFLESKKRKHEANSKDEMETLLFINSFRKKIQNTGVTSTKLEDSNNESAKKHLDICKLHGLINCLSCKNNFNVNLNSETADFDEKDWLMHKLVFDRREFEGQVRDDLNELVVIDPRDQAEKLKKNFSKLNKDKK